MSTCQQLANSKRKAKTHGRCGKTRRYSIQWHLQISLQCFQDLLHKKWFNDPSVARTWISKLPYEVDCSFLASKSMPAWQRHSWRGTQGRHPVALSWILSWAPLEFNLVDNHVWFDIQSSESIVSNEMTYDTAWYHMSCIIYIYIYINLNIQRHLTSQGSVHNSLHCNRPK